MTIPSWAKLIAAVALASRPDWLPAGGRDVLDRFPPPAACRAACDATLAHLLWWQAAADLFPHGDVVRDGCLTARHRLVVTHSAWHTLLLAHEAGGTPARLRWLAELQGELPEADWCCGRMPPPPDRSGGGTTTAPTDFRDAVVAVRRTMAGFLAAAGGCGAPPCPVWVADPPPYSPRQAGGFAGIDNC